MHSLISLNDCNCRVLLNLSISFIVSASPSPEPFTSQYFASQSPSSTVDSGRQRATSRVADIAGGVSAAVLLFIIIVIIIATVLILYYTSKAKKQKQLARTLGELSLEE